MRVNSDKSISRALSAHKRLGSWDAVRKAASERADAHVGDDRMQRRPVSTGNDQAASRE